MLVITKSVKSWDFPLPLLLFPPPPTPTPPSRKCIWDLSTSAIILSHSHASFRGTHCFLLLRNHIQGHFYFIKFNPNPNTGKADSLKSCMLELEVVHKLLEVVHRLLEVVHKLLEVVHRLLEVVHKLLEVVHRLLEVVHKLLEVVHQSN